MEVDGTGVAGEFLILLICLVFCGEKYVMEWSIG